MNLIYLPMYTNLTTNGSQNVFSKPLNEETISIMTEFAQLTKEQKTDEGILSRLIERYEKIDIELGKAS